METCASRFEHGSSKFTFYTRTLTSLEAHPENSNRILSLGRFPRITRQSIVHSTFADPHSQNIQFSPTRNQRFDARSDPAPPGPCAHALRLVRSSSTADPASQSPTRSPSLPAPYVVRLHCYPAGSDCLFTASSRVVSVDACYIHHPLCLSHS